MNSYKITFLPSETTCLAAEGSTLLSVMISAGLTPDAPCGGKGTCAKCKISIKQGNEIGEALACQTIVNTDMVVDTSTGTVDSSKRAKILASGAVRTVQLNPYPILSHKLNAPHFAVAFDIGTTTVVGYLLKDGKQLAAKSMMNPQIQYGADVISRANFVLENGFQGQVALSSTIQNALDTLIHQLCEENSFKAEQIEIVTIVGNTCMHHLFMNLSPDTLVMSPYMPRLSEASVLDAAEYGIHINAGGKLLLFPNIAGFVGGDTVGCMLATDFDKLEKYTLMIDVGTNGELVLGNREKRIACSTAAGPAFEGAKITCGMRGASGAIDHVKFENNALEISTIDAQMPKGICGSGLMDIIATLLENGFIDESGKLLDAGEHTTLCARQNEFRIDKIDNKPVFVLSFEKESATGEKIYISQKDIREVQLAKAAMAAGIILMTDELEISLDEIHEVLIAGAFGNYMSPHSACVIGLIPRELEKKIKPIGNAAGEGSKLAAISVAEFEHAKTLASTTCFLELASKPQFQDCFVDELEFCQEVATV